MALPAGLLRERVELQTPTRTANASGGALTTWATASGDTVWARVEPLRGDERVTGQQVDAAVGYKVTIRHRSGITPTGYRVLWGSKELLIRAALDMDGRGEATTLMCDEVSA